MRLINPEKKPSILPVGRDGIEGILKEKPFPGLYFFIFRTCFPGFNGFFGPSSLPEFFPPNVLPLYFAIYLTFVQIRGDYYEQTYVKPAVVKRNAGILMTEIVLEIPVFACPEAAKPE